jgi:hypothetical protein
VYCRWCGAENRDNAYMCIKCGRNLHAVPGGGPPPPGQGQWQGTPSAAVPNYLVYSILSTLCCCLPFGIVAIVYSTQVDPKLRAGDYQGALASSNKAKQWCWIAFAIGLVTTAIGIFIQILALVAQQR